MRLLLFLVVLFVLSFTWQCRDYSEDVYKAQFDYEIAIGEFWGIDNIPIALAVRHAESLDGKWTFRREITNIYHEKWVQKIPGIKERFKKYGWDIISSCGDFQCFYPTALVNGFKGSPWELRENIFTNAKYSAKVWNYYDKKYAKMEDKISAYNHGHPWKNRHGEYINWKYLELVMTNYNKFKDY